MNDPLPDPTASATAASPSSESPTSHPPAPSTPAPPPRNDRDLGYWLRRLLVCNPFFLVSAALLLYAVARLSSDSTLFAEETKNLLFNFLALQSYSLLLVFTAIRLARHSIWYDSALLGVLEHGLVLVPFLLLSQAIFIAPELGWLLVAVAGAAATGRTLWFRKGYPQFNLPTRAIQLGGAVLGLNMIAPVVARQIVESTSVEDWAAPNRFIWAVLLPLVVVGANLLPRPSRYSQLNPERSWIPILIYGLWVGGTGVHAWSLGYVCKQPFTWSLLVPAVWAATWTLLARASDFVPVPNLRLRVTLLGLTFLIPLCSLDHPSIATSLLGLNLALYVGVMTRGPIALRSVARELAIASVVGLAVLIPSDWLQPMLVRLEITRIDWILLVVGAHVARCCWRFPSPAIGLASALLLGIGIASSAPVNFSGTLALQAAFAWMLVHSLRWNDGPGSGLRYVGAAAWVGHALLSTREASWQQGASITLIAALVIGAWWIIARPKGSRHLVFVPVVSFLPLVASPANWLISLSPAGVLALVLSFVLFGIGTAAAYLRNHWEAGRRSVVSPEQ